MSVANECLAGLGIGLLALASAPGVARAVPACPTPIDLAQPDGQRVTVVLRGDESRHWHEDRDGFTVVREARTGRWVYAVRAADGRLAPGSLAVGRDDPRQLGLTRHLLPPRGPARARAAAAPSGGAAAGAGPAAAQAGTMKNLVVLAQFPDLPATHTKAEFDALFNVIGYTTDGAAGSVRDFYNEVSYGTLAVQSVVTDWITLDHGYAWYGGNDVSGNDLRPREMVQEALAKLEASGFDFSTLDADGDGWVDGLTVIHSGGGEEYSGNDADYIWSHQWQMTSTVTYDGKSMLQYHTEPERRGWDAYPTTWGITRIGVICHETGHFLGLPDLYDYGYDSEGAGNFCLMAGGSWNGNSGTLPSHPSAWCKTTMGWVTPVTVTGEGTYAVPRVEDTAAVFRLGGSFPLTEYFLVENRQGQGFDAGLPGPTRGLLIWHVDETQPNNDNQAHYLVDLEEASGVQHLELNQNAGEDSDYYRDGNATLFTGASSPGNTSYAGTPLGLDIVGVSASAALMSFTVGATPVARFDWAAIASPRAQGVPFDVAIRARNVAGGTAGSFTGAVAVAGHSEEGSTNLTVGRGTSSWNYPLATLYHDARTQVIYPSGELGATPRTFAALSLNVSALPGQALNAWTIRMKHTSLASYPGSPVWESAGWTTVYSASTSIGQTGWVTFAFSTPFAYNGASNVMVDFSFNNSSYTTDGYCLYSAPGGNRSIYYRTDSGAGDPLGWPTNGYNPARTRTTSVPNIRLYAVQSRPVLVSPTASGAFVGGVWTGRVAVLEAARSVRLDANDGSGHTGSSAPFDVAAVVSNVTLLVTSDYGGAVPSVGSHSYTSGTWVSATVTGASAIVSDATSWRSYACTGWTGTGSVPASGVGTNAGFTLTADSSIAWRWVVTDLVLSNQTVGAATNFQARDSVTARDGFRGVAPGPVTLRAGTVVRLQPGFTSASGSVLRATLGTAP